MITPRQRRPRPPAPPVLTREEASAAAMAVHADARQREAWARSTPADTRHAQAAAILRSALIKLLSTSHPDQDGPDVAAAVVKAWDELSDKDEERERRHRERFPR